ncbi:hypothetical protein [Rhizobium sp.]
MIGAVIRGFLVAALSSGSFIGAAFAAPAGEFDPSSANVSCVSEGDKASDAEIDAFLSNPEKLLADNPGGGLGLSNSIKVLASSSSKAYASIIAMSKNGSAVQQASIGAGLARAFGECKDSQPDFAQKMQEDIAVQKGSDLFVAYLAASNQPVVASVNTPGTASSAQGGGETSADSSQTAGTNARQYSANSPFQNTTGTYDTGSGIGLVGEDPSSP